MTDLSPNMKYWERRESRSNHSPPRPTEAVARCCWRLLLTLNERVNELGGLRWNISVISWGTRIRSRLAALSGLIIERRDGLDPGGRREGNVCICDLCKRKHLRLI